MAADVLQSVRIGGIACCVPDHLVTIDEFESELGSRQLERFKKTTGIDKKYCCREEHIITAGDLCYVAAERLFAELNIDKASIDALILVTQTADYIRPSTACILQYRLGLSENCLAYDINLGCSGYVYGLHAAAAYLQSGSLKRVLLLAGETDAHVAPMSNLLFGEAGSATLLEYEEGSDDMEFLLRTQGEGFRYILLKYGGYRHGIGSCVEGALPGRDCFVWPMDGSEVFNFSIRETPRLVKDFFSSFGYSAEDFDLFVFHQANLIILEQIIKRLKLPREKCPISLDCYGNTSSASIPVGICDYFNRLNKEAKKSGIKNIIVCGYGIGLSLGVASIQIDGNLCLPITTTNQSYEDGI